VLRRRSGLPPVPAVSGSDTLDNDSSDQGVGVGGDLSRDQIRLALRTDTCFEKHAVRVRVPSDLAQPGGSLMVERVRTSGLDFQPVCQAGTEHGYMLSKPVVGGSTPPYLARDCSSVVRAQRRFPDSISSRSSVACRFSFRQPRCLEGLSGPGMAASTRTTSRQVRAFETVERGLRCPEGGFEHLSDHLRWSRGRIALPVYEREGAPVRSPLWTV